MKKLIAAAALLAASTAPAHAGQILLDKTSVIAWSSYFSNCCDFKPGNIFDQQTGPVDEATGLYWIAQDNGPANAFITIDLGASYTLTGFELYNTSNGGIGDRGTGDFSISGSTTQSGGTLIAPTLIVSGTLTPETSKTPIAQSFLASGTYRYLTFNPLTVSAGGTACCGANVFGLSELRVFGTAVSAVPEPGTWTLMIAGMGLIGSVLRRTRRQPRTAGLA